MYTEDIIEDLKENYKEFFQNGVEAIKKKRFNVAVSDLYKAITILIDAKIYEEIGRLPKNHSDRFSILERHFKEIAKRLSNIFKKYRESYNLRMEKKDAEEMLNHAKYFEEIIKI